MNGLRSSLILLTIALNCCVGVPIALSENLTEKWVEKAAAPLIENQVADGLSIGYIEGKSWGIVHLGTSNQAKKKASNLTLYEIGSISKVFTSLLLADAVVRGEIDLDATANIANKAEIRFPSRDGRSIKWIDLSTHRSGLPRLPSNLVPSDPTNPYLEYDSKKAATFLNQYELPRQPGESHEYSNFGASVLGYLVAQQAGKTYQQLLQERIAKPLKMTDCTVSLSSDQKKRLATPHEKFGSVTSSWTFADLPGVGGVHATMRDMMRFAKAQLAPPKGKLGEAIELAWKQQCEADASGPAMGLGWHIWGDGQTRWHNGGTGGFRSAMFINRESRCAVVVLCNTGSIDEVDLLAMKLIKKAAGLEVKLEPSKRDKWDKTPPKLSPFTQVRFENEQVIVVYEDKAYQWLELDGIKVEDLVDSSKKQFGGKWQKRISEDLVELLWGMDHRPGKMVKLRLVDLKTKKDFVVKNAPMTKENRSATSENRQSGHKAAAGKRGEEDLPIDEKLRSRLVGRYQLKPDFIFTVTDDDGHLMVQITNQPNNEVFPDSPIRWSYRGLDASIEFKLMKTGSAKSLVLHQNGNKQTARRIKTKPSDTVEHDTDKLAIDEKLRSRLVGRYQLNSNFIFAVSDRDGQLMVGATNQATLKLNPDSPTRWSCRAVNATIKFELTKTGPAMSLVLHQGGAKQTARRIKDDLAIDAKLRSRLVGRYQLRPDFIFDVKDRDGHLLVGITNQSTQEVFPDSPNRWSYRGIDATLEFELKKAGSAKSLVLHQNGASQKARRIK